MERLSEAICGRFQMYWILMDFESKLRTRIAKISEEKHALGIGTFHRYLTLWQTCHLKGSHGSLV